jgi:Fe-S-cluster containining protein
VSDKKRLPILPEDVERGLRFNHLVDDQMRLKYAELAAVVRAIGETLIARGLLSAQELEERRKVAFAGEMELSKKEVGPRISSVADKYNLTDLPDIDCEALFPLCKARCCRLTFALSLQDLDERIVRWDYGAPYKIAHRSDDSYCVHNIQGTGRCGVYENRPGICRKYDCRNDKRIWTDFENKIPAPDRPLSASEAEAEQ